MRRAALALGAALALAAAGAAPLGAQFKVTGGGSVVKEDIATKYRLDFAIPDAPAFTLVEADASAILRPATVRELAAAVSDFVHDGGNLGVPRAFAVEFAPAMLIGGRRLTIARYQHAPQLYRLRLSASTRRDGSDGPTRLAVGLRVALVDDADLRTQTSYLRDATAIATSINRIFAAENEEHRPTPGTELTLDDLSPARRAQVDELIAAQRKRAMEKAWNARVLDVAVAARGDAGDSLGNAAAMKAYAAWVTYGQGFGEWGQLLLGLKASTVRDSVTNDFGGSAALGTRLYAGTNEYKVFLEGQGEWRKGDDTYLLNGGGEAKLITGGWVQFTGGVRWVGPGKPELVGSLAFKLGLLGL